MSPKTLQRSEVPAGFITPAALAEHFASIPSGARNMIGRSRPTNIPRRTGAMAEAGACRSCPSGPVDRRSDR